MSTTRQRVADELWRQVEEDFHKPLAPEFYGTTARELMLARADRILEIVGSSEHHAAEHPAGEREPD